MTLLLALHWVVDEDSGLEDMQLPLGEQADLGKESTGRPLERVGEEEAKDKTAENGETAHESEEPEPSGFTADSTHVQDSIGEELGRRLSELITKVEEHDSFGSLLSGVPSRQGPKATRDETGFGDTEE